MTAHVLFISPRAILTRDAPGVGNIRRREVVAPGAVSEAEVAEGEMVMVVNTGDAAVLFAYGSAPDAAALEQTNGTSAGLPVPAGQVSPPVMAPTGSKVSVKAEV